MFSFNFLSTSWILLTKLNTRIMGFIKQQQKEAIQYNNNNNKEEKVA